MDCFIFYSSPLLSSHSSSSLLHHPASSSLFCRPPSRPRPPLFFPLYFLLSSNFVLPFLSLLPPPVFSVFLLLLSYPLTPLPLVLSSPIPSCSFSSSFLSSDLDDPVITVHQSVGESKEQFYFERTVFLRCVANSNPPVHYTWRRGREVLSQGTDSGVEIYEPFFTQVNKHTPLFCLNLERFGPVESRSYRHNRNSTNWTRVS